MYLSVIIRILIDYSSLIKNYPFNLHKGLSLLIIENKLIINEIINIDIQILYI